jgi:Rrf2 family protein
MIDIAEHDRGEFITLKEVAERQGISEKYLESILPALTKAGLLDGVRGKGGGYKLARAPESCTVGSILKLVEGHFAPVSCLERSPNNCPRASECRTLPMWQQFQTTVDEFFNGITIADLCGEKCVESNYVI